MAPRRNPNNSPHTQIMPEGEIQAQLNDLQAAVRIHTIDPLSGSNYNYPNSSLPTETTASLAKRTQATLYNNFYNNYKELSASSESTVAVASSSPVSSILSMQQQQQQPQQFNNMSPMQTTNNKPTTNNNINHNSNTLSNHHNLHNNTANGTTVSEYIYVQCCYPNGDCHKCDTSLICTQDLSDCVKVICNNENCSMGQYMHKQCFDGWEQSILSSLKNMGGRVRSWSERQKVQNIWTKKGYDLIYKLCNCKCGRGHLRKDLEWIAPKASVTFNGSNNSQQRIMNDSNSGGGGGGVGGILEEEDKKNKSNSGKKKRNRSNNNSNSTSNQVHKNNCQTQLQQQSQTHLQQEQQSQLSDCRTSTVAANVTGGMEQMRNSYNNLLPAPNVGVIGSGLPQHHHNNTNTNQQKQTPSSKLQCSTEAPGSGVGSLLLNGGGQSSLVNINSNNNNNNNILGLDLGSGHTNSTSSGGNNSGSSSPSAILTTQNGGTNDQPNCMQLQHVPQNFTMNGYYSQQPPHMGGAPLSKNPIQPASIMAASLTKTILNGLNNLNNSALLGSGNNSGNTIVGNNTTTNLIHGSVSSSNTAPHALIINPQQHAANSVLTLNGFKQLSTYEQQQYLLQQKLKEVEIYSEKVRSTSGCNGIFSRRLDFSSFNILPKTRLNSYQVKIEDEGNHGNDETRLFILSSLAQSQKNRVACIICEETMLVFDRYPLVDGSFFLSPKQHSADCIEVKYEGRAMFLTCVCLRCSDGSSTNRSVSCRFCAEKWDGSNLVLGTMYAYDVFAAMPCCMERIKCNNCFKMLLHPQQRLNFYSDYSHCVTCPFCATQDTHFVKPLNYCYVKSIPSRLLGIA